MVVRIIGKFLNIMTTNKVELRVTSKLSKEVYFRETKRKNYLIYSMGSELLLFDGVTWNRRIKRTLFEPLIDIEIFKLLNANRFFEDSKKLPASNVRWLQVFRIIIFILGMSSATYIINNLNNINYLSYNFENRNLVQILLVGILFSFVTTFFHELMHIICSNNIANIREIINFSFKKSVATIDITHVWFWPLFSRCMAILSGLLFDIFIVSILLALSNKVENTFLTLCIYIMFLRILWQFRVKHPTDIQLLVFMLIDNPFLKIDFEDDKNSLTVNEKILWQICCFFNLIINIVIFLLVTFFVLKFLRYT